MAPVPVGSMHEAGGVWKAAVLCALPASDEVLGSAVLRHDLGACGEAHRSATSATRPHPACRACHTGRWLTSNECKSQWDRQVASRVGCTYAPVGAAGAGGGDVGLLQQPGTDLGTHQQARQRPQLRPQEAHLLGKRRLSRQPGLRSGGTGPRLLPDALGRCRLTGAQRQNESDLLHAPARRHLRGGTSSMEPGWKRALGGWFWRAAPAATLNAAEQFAPASLSATCSCPNQTPFTEETMLFLHSTTTRTC